MFIQKATACRSHPPDSEIAISTERVPYNRLTMNLIQVKFNLEGTSSGKWKVMKQYAKKGGKLHHSYHYRVTGGHRAGDRGEIQGKVSESEPSKDEGMQNKEHPEKVTTHTCNSPRI